MQEEKLYGGFSELSTHGGLMPVTGWIPFTVFATLLIFFVTLIVIFVFIVTLPKTDFKIFKFENSKTNSDTQEQK